jgi:uncharacterized protein YbjT (DUF2867 family)
MRLVLTGATGFIGREVLKQALDDPSIERITVFTRRPTGRSSPKITELVVQDFTDYSSVQRELRADACIWCLGVLPTAASRDEYVRITFDYAMAAAKALFAENPALRFCFLSGAGADPNEKSWVLYGKIKGRTERELAKLSPNVVSFRPAFVRAAPGDARPLMARLYTPIADVVDRFTDQFSVTCEELASCLLDVAKNGAGEPVLDNRAIRRRRREPDGR